MSDHFRLNPLAAMSGYCPRCLAHVEEFPTAAGDPVVVDREAYPFMEVPGPARWVLVDNVAHRVIGENSPQELMARVEHDRVRPALGRLPRAGLLRTLFLGHRENRIRVDKLALEIARDRQHRRPS